MAKWRMTQIVRQAQSLCQILVQTQIAGNDPADLRHFEGVSAAPDSDRHRAR